MSKLGSKQAQLVPICLQAGNKERALAILRARLFEEEVQRQRAEISAKRANQVQTFRKTFSLSVPS